MKNRQQSSRVRPILHVSHSSSESEWDEIQPQKKVLLKSPVTPSNRFTPPDASITEREPLSSDEDADVGSVRSMLKGAVVQGLRASTGVLEERFDQLKVSEIQRLSRPEECVVDKLRKMSLGSRRNKLHRRVYSGTRTLRLSDARVAAPSRSESKCIRTTCDDKRCSQPDHAGSAISFICPHCGHCFALRKSLNMHRKVCFEK